MLKFRRRSRIVLYFILGVVVFAIGWLTVVRATSPMRSIRTYTIPEAPNISNNTTRLRIAAYNIAHGRGLAESNWDGTLPEREARLKQIASLLSELQLDVVVLNEVDFNSTWSGGLNEARLIATQAGFAYVAEQASYDTGLPFFYVRFGNAILSRYPIVSAELIDFPTYLHWEALVGGKKQGLLCELQLNETESVRVLAVHLEHRDETTRVGSAETILKLARQEGPPLIAAGDFNSTPLGYPHAQIGDGQHNAMTQLFDSGLFLVDLSPQPNKEDLTFRADDPYTLIDWVLVPHGATVRARSVPNVLLSDHRPVVVELQLPLDSSSNHP
ncbi:MAG: endonuclease/exonuclease/phosphatase family protein [Planctomycetes bacterium]|nr:endonuclease/exonuclease/phosphatase family protein [Planctomycetota bacterium]